MQAADKIQAEEIEASFQNLVKQGVITQLKPEVFSEEEMRKLFLGDSLPTNLLEHWELTRKYQKLLRDPVNHL